MFGNSNAFDHRESFADRYRFCFQRDDLFRQQHNAYCKRCNHVYLDARIIDRNNSNCFADRNHDLYRDGNSSRLYQYRNTIDHGKSDSDGYYFGDEHNDLFR